MEDIINNEVWDIRDLIERFEELEASREEQTELDKITTILEELQGNGGDEQWRGGWYPVTMIREDYFTEYCQDLVSDIGDMPREIPSYIEIDWEATADNIKVDYSEIEIDGTTYFYR